MRVSDVANALAPWKPYRRMPYCSTHLYGDAVNLPGQRDRLVERRLERRDLWHVSAASPLDRARIAAMYGGLCAGATSAKSCIVASTLSSTFTAPLIGPPCTALKPIASS